MAPDRGTAIALLCLLAVVTWMVWPTEQPQHGMTEEARLEYQHQQLTAVLLKFLPDSYLDTIAAYPDSALAAIAMPGIDPENIAFAPTWRGTIGELRQIIALKSGIINPLAMPQEDE